ncbi:MAG: hypothetical protein MZW92_65325, partial [Comamonadaceae bacterium]|nr:hypothetical protein [Comamonadaceae bacterium]
ARCAGPDRPGRIPLSRVETPRGCGGIADPQPAAGCDPRPGPFRRRTQPRAHRGRHAGTLHPLQEDHPRSSCHTWTRPRWMRCSPAQISAQPWVAGTTP